MTDDELKRLIGDAAKQSAEEAAATRAHFDETAAELHRHFDVVTESMRHEIRLVAEGVANVEEKLDREVQRLDDKMTQGFAETQAMFKFSHAEIERRVRTLEDSYADLKTRVERLESTTTH
ncbi:MAG TPA: hypothetical protein VFN10_01210 [Thermoanaerobaculia bacterium]|nr:hypothetical protein [Thermoanaerobaculia bacterium]